LSNMGFPPGRSIADAADGSTNRSLAGRFCCDMLWPVILDVGNPMKRRVHYAARRCDGVAARGARDLCAAVSFLLISHYGGLQVRSSLICATTVCTWCEHAQPKWAKRSSHTTSAPALEDLPHRRIVRWLSAYFPVPN